MAFEEVEGEAAEVGGAGAGEVFGGEGGEWGAEDALGEGGGFGGKRDGAGAAVIVAGDTVAGWRVVEGAAAKVFAADDAVAEFGHPAHETVHPEREVESREPDAVDLELVEDGEREAEDGVVGGLLGQGLFEDFGDELEGGGTGVVDGVGERRGENFEGVETDEGVDGLARAFGVGRADVGHGLEGPAEAAAGSHGVAGDALDAALIAGEEADEEVGLEEGPGAENDRFTMALDHCECLPSETKTRNRMAARSL